MTSGLSVDKLESTVEDDGSGLFDILLYAESDSIDNIDTKGVTETEMLADWVTRIVAVFSSVNGAVCVGRDE